MVAADPRAARGSPGSVHGEKDRERASPALTVRLGPDVSSVQRNKLVCQRQPEPRSLEALRVGRLELGERPEETWQILAPDPDPGILYGDLKEVRQLGTLAL